MKFYEQDRTQAKELGDVCYFEALEAIARAAFDLWKELPVQDATPEIGKCADRLYDALADVNFMEEGI